MPHFTRKDCRDLESHCLLQVLSDADHGFPTCGCMHENTICCVCRRTSRRTTWTWRRCARWRTRSPAGRAPRSSSPTTAGSSTASPPTSWRSRTTAPRRVLACSIDQPCMAGCGVPQSAGLSCGAVQAFGEVVVPGHRHDIPYEHSAAACPMSDSCTVRSLQCHCAGKHARAPAAVLMCSPLMRVCRSGLREGTQSTRPTSNGGQGTQTPPVSSTGGWQCWHDR